MFCKALDYQLFGETALYKNPLLLLFSRDEKAVDVVRTCVFLHSEKAKCDVLSNKSGAKSLG